MSDKLEDIRYFNRPGLEARLGHAQRAPPLSLAMKLLIAVALLVVGLSPRPGSG